MANKIGILNALQSLKPNSEWALRDGVLDWLDSVETEPTQAEINTEISRLQAEQDATQYQRNREPEYPPVGDQLDAILKHLNYRRTQGEDLVQDLDDIVGAWLNVKSRYPKNGSN